MLSYSIPFILLILLDRATNSEKDFCQNKPDTANNNITQLVETFTARWPVNDWIENGYFDKEYICDINAHWLSFDPPDRSSFIILAVLYFNIMFTGFLGNFLVILLFFRCKSLRTPGNTLILNLALSDGMITLKTPIFIYNCFYMGPALGDIACRIYGFVGGLSGTVSIVTLSAISFDRYFMIKFPLNRAYSNLRVKICLIIIWLYSLIFSLIPALDIGLGKYTYEGYLTSCSFDYLTQNTSEKYFIFTFFIAAWVVPFVLITFCYVNIIMVVEARSVLNKGSQDYFRHVKDEQNKRQEIKLALTVFCSICLWFLAWTPYSVVSLLGIFGQKRLISPLTSMIPAVFCKITSCINPFVYALSHPRFRSELRNIICGSVTRTEEPRKVWFTKTKDKPNFESYGDSSDVEEEVVELDTKYVTLPRQISFETSLKPYFVETRSKRKPSTMEMFCLPPNFSNKSSTFRRISRKWSAKERENKLREGE